MDLCTGFSIISLALQYGQTQAVYENLITGRLYVNPISHGGGHNVPAPFLNVKYSKFRQTSPFKFFDFS